MESILNWLPEQVNSRNSFALSEGARERKNAELFYTHAFTILAREVGDTRMYSLDTKQTNLTQDGIRRGLQ